MDLNISNIDFEKLLSANVVYDDGVLSKHHGCVSHIQIQQNNIFCYCIFFGQNANLPLTDLNKNWWIKENILKNGSNVVDID